MATGDTLLVFPAQNGILGISSDPDPQFKTRGGLPCWSFDPATQEDVHFVGILPQHFSGGSAGIEVYIHWTAESSTTTSQNVRWLTAMTPFADDGDDVDSLGTITTAKLYTASVPAVSGDFDVGNTSHSSSEIHGAVAGDYIVVRVIRDSDNASDTMNTGDAELYAVELRES